MNITARKVVEEAVVRAGLRNRHVLRGIRGEAVAPQHGAVVGIARTGNRIAGRRVHLLRARCGVVGRVEGSGVVVGAVERMNAGVAHAVLKMQLRRSLVGVLRKELIQVGAIGRFVARTNLGVGVVQAKRRIRLARS